MPITYRIDEGRKLVVTTVGGPLSEAEIHAHAAAVERDPRVGTSDRSIVDITESAKPCFGGKVISELAMTAQALGQLLSARRVALIASTDAGYGLARVFQGFREGTGDGEMRVFRSRPEAEAWLELKPDPD